MSMGGEAGRLGHAESCAWVAYLTRSMCTSPETIYIYIYMFFDYYAPLMRAFRLRENDLWIEMSRPVDLKWPECSLPHLQQHGTVSISSHKGRRKYIENVLRYCSRGLVSWRSTGHSRKSQNVEHSGNVGCGHGVSIPSSFGIAVGEVDDVVRFRSLCVQEYLLYCFKLRFFVRRDPDNLRFDFFI